MRFAIGLAMATGIAAGAADAPAITVHPDACAAKDRDGVVTVTNR